MKQVQRSSLPPLKPGAPVGSPEVFAGQEEQIGSSTKTHEAEQGIIGRTQRFTETNLQVSPGDQVFGSCCGLGQVLVWLGVISADLHSHGILPEPIPGNVRFIPRFVGNVFFYDGNKEEEEEDSVEAVPGSSNQSLKPINSDS